MTWAGSPGLLDVDLGHPRQDFTAREGSRLAVFDYIEVFYNRMRMHSPLGYQSPASYEQRINRLGYVP